MPDGSDLVLILGEHSCGPDNSTKNFNDEPERPSGEWAEPLSGTTIPDSTGRRSALLGLLEAAAILFLLILAAVVVASTILASFR